MNKPVLQIFKRIDVPNNHCHMCWWDPITALRNKLRINYVIYTYVWKVIVVRRGIRTAWHLLVTCVMTATCCREKYWIIKIIAQVTCLRHQGTASIIWLLKSFLGQTYTWCNKVNYFLPSGPKKAPALQVVSVQSTDIPPKENVTYAKQTQTTASGVTELRDGKLFVYSKLIFCQTNLVLFLKYLVFFLLFGFASTNKK